MGEEKKTGGKEMNEEELFVDAIYTFGPGHQIRKAVEEMSELTKELMKDLDGKGNQEHIAEEMADVEITLAQLKLIHSNTELVEKYREEKLRYLRRLIFKEREGDVP